MASGPVTSSNLGLDMSTMSMFDNDAVLNSGVSADVRSSVFFTMVKTD